MINGKFPRIIIVLLFSRPLFKLYLMPNSVGSNDRGKVDLLSLFGVSFLVVSLVAIVGITSNPLKTVLINSFAARKGKTAEDYGSPNARQNARLAETGSTQANLYGPANLT